MIRIINVTKNFSSVKAVDNFSLNIESGIYGLVGQNGAGKSTLFRLIAGVYRQDEGEIIIDSFDSNTKEGKELVFYLSDDPYVERQDKIKDMLSFYENFYEIDYEKFNELIKKFQLPRNTTINSFSKGMKRQLFLSLALAIKTKYLLLDEAFDGLDPIILETIKEELLNAKEGGKVIVASSHNISTLEKLVDSFIMVTKGRLTGNNSNENIGVNYVKYQVLFKNEVNDKDFDKTELEIVSLKKYGSIYNIVVMDAEDLEEKINSVGKTILLERVPIDIEEIVKLDMILARKEIENENK